MSTFASKSVESVRTYWDARPCNVRHSPRQIGTREYFDEVEARKYFVEPHIPRFAEFERWNGRRVLEIGCGIGTDTINFARAGARVTAVDLSPNSLEIARERVGVFGLGERVQFHVANAQNLSEIVPPEPYDLVYSFGVIHHTPDPGRVIDQIRRHYVRAGSTLKLMVYHRYAWKVLAILATSGRGAFWKLDELVARQSEAQTGCPVTYTFSRRSLTKLLGEGFEINELWVDHIFPYRVAEYVQYRYVKQLHFRLLPPSVFRMMERTLGWHLCLSASVSGVPQYEAR